MIRSYFIISRITLEKFRAEIVQSGVGLLMLNLTFYPKAYRNNIFEANPYIILGKQQQNDCSNRSQKKWKISTALLLTKYIAKSCTNTWVKIFLGCSCTTDFRKCTPYFIVDCSVFQWLENLLIPGSCIILL